MLHTAPACMMWKGGAGRAHQRSPLGSHVRLYSYDSTRCNCSSAFFHTDRYSVLFCCAASVCVTFEVCGGHCELVHKDNHSAPLPRCGSRFTTPRRMLARLLPSKPCHPRFTNSPWVRACLHPQFVPGNIFSVSCVGAVSKTCTCSHTGALGVLCVCVLLSDCVRMCSAVIFFHRVC